MGASSWFYSVPFRLDVQAALDELRQRVYDEGTYYKAEPNPDMRLSREEVVAKYEWGRDSGILDAMVDEWDRFQRLAQPVDPDSLFDWQGSEGTHSIIDMINGVSVNPEIFAVAPLSDEEVLAEFGTPRPSSAQVRGRLEQGWVGDRDRWHGTYLASYGSDGTPDQIHFFGYSGD